MSAPVETRRPLPSLAVVRLLPALCIFTAHVTQFPLFRDGRLQQLASGVPNKAGYEAVSFFIVLSGFILTWVLGPSAPDRVFLAKRYLKILPAHAVTWAVCLALFAGGTALANGMNLLLVHGWVPHASYYFTANIPAWTLGVELLFYATFVVWIGLFRRLGTRTLALVAAALTAFVVALPWLLAPLPDGTTIVEPAFTQGGIVTPVSEWKFWAVYIFPPTRLAEALLGMILALLLRRGAWPRVPVTVAVASLLAAVWFATEELPLLAATSSITIVPILLVVGSLALADVHGTPSAFRIERLAPVARYTFTFYLVQWTVIWFWHERAPEAGYATEHAIGVYLALLSTTVVLATLLHRLVEVPVTTSVVAAMRTHRGAPVDDPVRDRPPDEDPSEGEQAALGAGRSAREGAGVGAG